MAKILDSNSKCVDLDYVRRDYSDLVDLAIIFNHEIVLCNGALRWKANSLMCYFIDGVWVHTPPKWHGPLHNKLVFGAIDLNNLAVARSQSVFAVEEYMKFYMQMGYSLCGFSEVFGQHEAFDFGLPDAKPVPEDHDGNSYIETPIEYMLRIYAGKVLKI